MLRFAPRENPGSVEKFVNQRVDGDHSAASKVPTSSLILRGKQDQRERHSPSLGARVPVNHPGGMIHRTKRTLLRANSLFSKEIRRFCRIWLRILPRNQMPGHLVGRKPNEINKNGQLFAQSSVPCIARPGPALGVQYGPFQRKAMVNATLRMVAYLMI